MHSCGLETASPFKQQHIVLATDCLQARDTILFTKFHKRNGIHVRIIALPADQIRERLARDGVNSEIDVVLCSSSYDALQIESAKLLQKIPKDSFPSTLNSKYISHSQMVAGLGFDPYVIVRRKEAPVLKNYGSLSSSEGFVTDLRDQKDMIPFYLFIYQKHGGSKTSDAEGWIEGLQAKCIKKLGTKDTLIYAQHLLTRYSSWLKNRNTLFVTYRHGELIFPNQRIGGSYFDMPTLGIVRQARNYSNALALMNYLVTPEGNKTLNKRLKTISFFEGSRRMRFKRFHSSPLKMEKFLPAAQQILE